MEKETRVNISSERFSTDFSFRCALKERVVRLLKSGGVVVLPSETSYMLAGNACLKSTVQRIRRLKNRPPGQVFSVAVSSVEKAKRWAEWNDRAEILAKRFLPGPLTLILPVKQDAPEIFAAGSDTIGLRIPGHALLLYILDDLEFPVTATSANVHGAPEPYSVRDVVQSVDLICDAGDLPVHPPSTIVDITGIPARFIRKGPISLEGLNI